MGRLSHVFVVLPALILMVSCSPTSFVEELRLAEQGIANSDASIHDKQAQLANLAHMTKDISLLKSATNSEKERLEKAIHLRSSALKSFARLHGKSSKTQQTQDDKTASSPASAISSEQLSHAGSDVEQLRQKLVDSTLDSETKERHMRDLVDLEMTLSKISSVPSEDHQQYQGLVSRVRQDVARVHAIAREIEDAEPLINDSTKASEDPLSTFGHDLELYLSSKNDDAVINYIKDEIPALEELADKLQNQQETSFKLPMVDSSGVDLEMEDATSIENTPSSSSTKAVSELPASKEEPKQETAVSKPEPVQEAPRTETVANPEPEPEPVVVVTQPAEEVTAAAIASLTKVKELERAVESSSLDTAQKEKFLSNLRSLERDSRALENPALTETQRSDLKSAMKLRVVMLKDMEKMLSRK